MEILRHFAFVRSLPLLRQKHVQLGPSAVPEDRSFCKSERFILCALSGSGQIRPTDHQAQIFVADTVPLSGLQAVGCQHLHSCTACWCRYRESWSVTVADKGSVVKRYHEVLAKSDLLVALYIIGGGDHQSPQDSATLDHECLNQTQCKSIQQMDQSVGPTDHRPADY